MCGIFAFVQQGELSSEELERLQQYFNTIKHRGPDHTSSKILVQDGYTVFLGFHRLAIIDPSPGSNPLLSDGDVYMVCNGEIYNYRYLIEKYKLPVKTGSDCEVILQLYIHWPQLWPQVLEELDGVFSFVLYDQKTHTLISARDRIGVRPLFEAKTIRGKVQYAFASEGKAIPLASAKPFEPGTFLELKLDNWFIRPVAAERRVWYQPSRQLTMPYTTAQSVLREVFTEAVRKRLVADRPIGFLVSGGLDSSLVAAVAHKLLGQKITTFSIGLQGSPDLVAARKVAKFLNSDHHEVIISVQDILDTVPEVIRHNESYDITTTRASIPMYLLAKYINQKTNIKVIFSGEGADELFGGYLYFHKAPGYAEFQHETQRLLRTLYMFDVLRGDRTTSAWGLEIRVPFLDADLITLVENMDPSHKMPAEHTIEKAILRRAFDGYLPDSVLYRQKEAFSDGVGYNSVRTLKEHAEKYALKTVKAPQTAAQPHTPEARYYYDLFQKHYSDRLGLHTEYYWMPMWHEDVTDPSATVLSSHQLKSCK